MLRRLLFFFQRNQFDRDMEDELRFHEEMKAHALADADGMSGDEARAAAWRRIGNPLRLREQSREPWTFATVETFARDVRHALRLMRRDPAFTFTALATLALGIGLNTAIFSVAYGVLWCPLPYPNPDRLVIVSSAQQTETGPRTFSTWAPVSYEALRPRVTALDHLAAYAPIDAQFTGRGEPLQLPGLTVSPNFFATLGVSPARGRGFLTGATAPDDDGAAIVSDRLWRTSLKADPAIVGQSITIDGLPRTVVGVLPPDFSFRPVVGSGTLALPEADIFLPNRWPGDTGRNAFLFLLGRMKSGVTHERAEAELTVRVNDSSISPAGALAPEGALAPNVRTRARAVGLQEYGTKSVRTLMLILLGEVSFDSTLLIGLVPALRVSGAAFGEGLSLHAGGARTTADRQGERLRTLLVAAQIAMTLVLLIGAGLLIHSFVRLTSVSPGFESSGRDGVVQTVKVTLPERLYDQPERIHAFARGVLDRIHDLPGVKAASLINSVPFGMMFIRGDFDIEGQPEPTLSAGKPKIDAGYFKTMGIPLLAGREFTARDTAEAPKVAIVSERIAREYFPGGPGEALGRHVRLSDRGEWLTVVGVVADIRQMGLDREVQPMLYVPFQQEREAFILRFVSFVARTATPASVVEGIRAEIRRAAPDLAIESTVTMDEAVAASVAPPRFRMLLLVLFAMAATLIATCGIYGLMAYAVTRRRREIGVRISLGAEPRDVLRLVLTRALRIVVAGLIVGLAGAAGVTRVLQTFLFGVTPTDPIAFTIVTLLLMAVGLMAAWLPARRATKIDPWAALRAE